MSEIINNKKTNELTESERQYHEKVFAKGGKTIENFEEFMVDFQKSRQDKELDRVGIELKAELEKVVEEKGYTEEDYHQMLNSKSYPTASPPAKPSVTSLPSTYLRADDRTE